MAGDIGLPIKSAADIDTPASGKYNLFLNSADSDQLYKKSSAGVSTPVIITGAGTVTSVAQSFTGGLISVAGTPITTAGTLALTVAGTSGGVPYFSSASTWASSGVLAANSILVGGGAGVAPSSITTGTGVVTALGVNVGSAGAFVVFDGALGSPSSAGTMPAFTLGGTISGGGNQINNVIIGTSNPLAGFFTTLSGTSSITLGTASTTVGSVVLQNATNANTITIQSGVTSSSHTLTLPVANASGVLTNDGSGGLTWAAASSGITIGGTTITSGTDNRILFQDATASDFVTQIANFTMGSVGTGILDVPTGYAIGGNIQLKGGGGGGASFVYVGYNAGNVPQSGRGATFIGASAGLLGVTGLENISIGAASNYNGGTFSYSLFIGSSSSSASGMSNTASNQAVIGMPLGNGYTQFYFGQGVSAVTGTPSGVTFNATPGTTAGGAFTILGGAGSGTNKAGGDNTSGGGTGTGAGVPGKYIIKTATTLGTGATVQSYVSRLTISGGAVTTDASTATWADALDFVFGTTTGTKIGTGTTQKIGFWNATPLAQQTTASAASTFVANTSLIANDTATFDGYTLGQVVKILRNLGILA